MSWFGAAPTRELAARRESRVCPSAAILPALASTGFLMLACLALILPSVACAVSAQGIIGWDGDKNAGQAFLDGSLGIRGRPELDLPGSELPWQVRCVGYEIAKNLPGDASVAWFNAEGWLPAPVTRFERDGCTVTITQFGDRVTLGGKDFVAAYARVAISNHSGVVRTLVPGQSPQFAVLRQDPPEIADQATATHDFASSSIGSGGTMPGRTMTH